MKNKFILKIILGGIVFISIIFIINVFKSIDRIGNYSISKPYEELTFTEKIASKISGYDIKTIAEMKKDEEKANEEARKEKIEEAKNQGIEVAKKIEAKIEEGVFTMDQYLEFQQLLSGKLSKGEIKIEEVNELNEKLSNGEISIEDYLN